MDPELYLRVREKEGRLYSDQIVAGLPSVPDGHPLVSEWRARSESARRLLRYISSRQSPFFVLDLGCGNGWLSNLLAQPGQVVLGLDQNRYELRQAARVFRSNPNLSFLEADIFSAPFPAGSFDLIIVASALQYFPNATNLLTMLLDYLKPNGEIHILDTPLYSKRERETAVLRSREYYASLGCPEMIDHYFHHRISDLDSLHPKMLYDPGSLTRRLKRWIGQIDSPFPWVVIRKQN
ncbi:MAG TPA: class I SAM-dependent methyltransferase [Anaerolineales bacterium]|nr:class I SAM-dependent methyltransferase [Anaerolineales bacterium]